MDLVKIQKLVEMVKELEVVAKLAGHAHIDSMLDIQVLLTDLMADEINRIRG